MDTNRQMLKIRAKKLGVLLYDARVAKRRSLDECADAMGITDHRLEAYESGEDSPSLPELEAAAYYLGVPLEHFWGRQAISDDPRPNTISQERLRQIRDRIIGTSIRATRDRLDISLAELADKTSLAKSTLRRYELGESSIPLPELELISRTLQLKLDELYDKKGPIGKWRIERQNIERFLELPPGLQDFVARPVNRPYIELAMRLNDLSVEKLRSIAEGLLEITY
ncbi:MAG TPA: helix-turn-helix transcriptional regulator [Anaerolineaceae bacterium]|nr:helix-turn-helix transcriptional regulator [Anaerolineaceae bacterium]